MSVRRYNAGYCYLVWFHEAGLNDEQVARYARHLGEFPRVVDVLGSLFSAVAALYVSLSDLRFDGVYLHVDTSLPKVYLKDLLIQYVGKFHLRVGADEVCIGKEGEDQVVSIGVDDCVALSLLREHDIDVNVVMRKFVLDDLQKEGSLLRTQVVDSISKKTAASLRDVRKTGREIIPFCLTAVEQVKLESSFPELKLEFAGKQKHPHAFSAAHRRCEMAVSLSFLGYRTDIVVKGDYDAVVKDFGGNFMAHLTRNRFNVHSCAPILDARDAMRFTTRSVELMKFKNSERWLPVYERMQDPAQRRLVVCNRPAQQCPLRAPFALMVHSNYDFSVDSLADALDMAGIDHCVGTFLFDPDCIVENNGFIEMQNCFWEKFKDKQGKFRIRFSFKNDVSLEYEHDFATYISLAVGHTLRSSAGVVYFVEVKDIRNGVLFFSIVRNLAPCIPRSVLSHCLWLGKEDLVAVQFYEYTSRYNFPDNSIIRGIIRGRPVLKLRKRRFLVRKRLVELGKVFALGLTQGKFTVSAIFDYLKSVNSRIVINGTDVTAPDHRLDAEKLFDLAYALYVFAFKKRFENSIVLNALLEDERACREDEVNGFWKRAFDKIASIINLRGKSVLVTEEDEERSPGIIRRILLWFHYERKFPVTLDEATQFIRFEEIVEKYAVIDWTVDQAYNYVLADGKFVCIDDQLEKALQPVVEDALSELSVVPVTVPIASGGGLVELRTNSCTRDDLVVIPVKGDGQCCFNSLLVAAGLDLSWRDLRASLSVSPFLKHLIDPDGTRRLLLNDEEWGDDEVIKLFSMHFKLNVCVHNVPAVGDVRDISYVSDKESSDFIHLRFIGNHFDALKVPSNSFKIPEVDSVVDELKSEKTFGAATGANVVELNFAKDSTEVVDVAEIARFESCGANVQGLRASLSKFSAESIAEAKLRANPVEKVSKGVWVCRSANKLVEIDKIFELTKNVKNVVDLCGAPGGFVQYLSSCKDVANVFSISKSDGSFPILYDINRFPVFNDKVLHLFGVNEKFSGDLMNDDDRNVFCSYVFSKCKSVDLVVADGSFDCTGCEDMEEAVNFPLFISEASVALSLLRSGGDFVMKVFDVFGSDTLELIAFLCEHFERIFLVKPITSRPASSEKYLVCRGFSVSKLRDVKNKDFIKGNFLKFLVNQIVGLNDLHSCLADLTVDFNDSFRVKIIRGFLGKVHLPKKRVSVSLPFSSTGAVVLLDGCLNDICIDDISCDFSCDSALKDFLQSLCSSRFLGSSSGVPSTSDIPVPLPSILPVSNFVAEPVSSGFSFGCECSISGCECVSSSVGCVSIGSRAIVSQSDSVFSGRLGDIELRKFRTFIRDALPSFKRSVTHGKRGVRHEWLFSDVVYSYGKRVLEPCASFDVLMGFVSSIVSEFSLSVPNACLLVYYPGGVEGLNLHCDDEPIHSSEQVITVSIGDPSTVVLARSKGRKVFRRFTSDDGSFYVFKDQKGFLHGVECPSDNVMGRWAFTFRVFKKKSDRVVGLPTDLPDRISSSVLSSSPFVLNTHESIPSALCSTSSSSFKDFSISFLSSSSTVLSCVSPFPCSCAKCTPTVSVSVPAVLDVPSPVCMNDVSVGEVVVLSESSPSVVSEVVSVCEKDCLDGSVLSSLVEDRVSHASVVDEDVASVTSSEVSVMDDSKLLNNVPGPLWLIKENRKHLKSKIMPHTRSGTGFFGGLRSKLKSAFGDLAVGKTSVGVGVEKTVVKPLCAPAKNFSAIEEKRVAPFLKKVTVHERADDVVTTTTACVLDIGSKLLVPSVSEHVDSCVDVLDLQLFKLRGRRIVQPATTGSCGSVNKRLKSGVVASTKDGQTRSVEPVVVGRCNVLDELALKKVLCGSFSPVETPLVCVAHGECPPRINCALLLANEDEFKVGRCSFMTVDHEKFLSGIENYEDVLLRRYGLRDLSAGTFCVLSGNRLSQCASVIVLFVSQKSVLRVLFEFLKIFPDIFKSSLCITFPICSFKFFPSECVLESLLQFDSNAYVHRYLFYIRDETLYKIFKREVAKIIRLPLQGAKASSSMYDHWQKTEADRRRDFNFSPNLLIGDSPDIFAKNAMIEQLELWRVREFILLEQHRNFYTSIPARIDSNVIDRVQMSGEGYGLYSVREKKFLVRPRNIKPAYEFAFDGARFVPFESAKKRDVQIASERLLVSSGTELMQDERLFSACKELVIGDFVLPSVSLRQGVPGCGKTTYILKNYRPPTAVDMGDLVLFPTREGVEDFRERAKKLNSEVSSYEKRNFRTLHSFLLNHSGEVFERVIVDEALMMHSGELMFAAFKSKCREMILVGDQRQIPYINRTPQCDVRFADPMRFASVSEVLNVSYRCTLTVAALLHDSYDGGMYATSDVRGEMKRIAFTCIADIDKQGGKKFLTFKQSEKLELAKLGFNVSTIHEFQGKQAANVVVVRLSRKKEDIYNRKAHALVAITRHTQSFAYITPVADDAISKYISKSQCLSANDFKHVKFINLKGGFIREDYVISEKHLDFSSRYQLNHDNIFSCVGKWGFSDNSTAIPVNTNSVYHGYFPRLQFTNSFTNGVSGDVGALQDFYDWVLPGNSVFSYVYDSYYVLNECDFNFHLEDTAFSESKRCVPRVIKFDKLKPVLRTSMASARPSNQIETLLAMIKRNQNVPDICGDIADNRLVNLMVNKFVDTYVHPSFKLLFESFSENIIAPNPASITEWLATQKPIVLQQIFNEEFIGDKFLTFYNFMVKSTVKPQLDTGAPYVYSSLQTIAFHSKDINAIFCPIFKEIKKRLCSVLDPRFQIFCDVSPEDFSDNLSKIFNADMICKLKKLEIDISKYDKSQGRVTLLFECALMRLFGVDEEMIFFWRKAHEVTTLYDRNNGVKCKVLFQRKSGDASTFLGNTMFLMAVVCVLFDLSDVVMGLFSGDDSLLVGGDIDHDRNMECAALFNLESKFFRSYDYMYFCSKFLIVSNNRFVFIPDPVKLITKLGRSDLVNYEHVEEYRISVCDLLKPYCDLFALEELSFAVNERYCVTGNHVYTFRVLCALCHDRSLFHSLYVVYVNDVLCMDRSRPSLD